MAKIKNWERFKPRGATKGTVAWRNTATNTTVTVNRDVTGKVWNLQILTSEGAEIGIETFKNKKPALQEARNWIKSNPHT